MLLSDELGVVNLLLKDKLDSSVAYPEPLEEPYIVSTCEMKS
jgi:hypothetical protein